MQKSIRVNILGREYPLRVHEEDEIATRNVVNFVNNRMQVFQRAHPEQSDLVTAVVTALAIAEEVMSAREGSNIVLEAIDREMKLLDQELAGALLA